MEGCTFPRRCKSTGVRLFLDVAAVPRCACPICCGSRIPSLIPIHRLIKSIHPSIACESNPNPNSNLTLDTIVPAVVFIIKQLTDHRHPVPPPQVSTSRVWPRLPMRRMQTQGRRCQRARRPPPTPPPAGTAAAPPTAWRATAMPPWTPWAAPPQRPTSSKSRRRSTATRTASSTGEPVGRLCQVPRFCIRRGGIEIEENQFKQPLFQ